MNGSSARIDDVDFLTRSSNRLDVLGAISEEPRTRRDLRTDTDFSRVTMSRILADLADRGWIVRRDGHYETTPAGDIVCTEMNRVFANLEAVDSLGETLQWLPIERFDFELERLGDAEVMLPNEHDLTAQIRWVDRQIQAADRVRSVGTWVAGEILDSLVDSTVAGECTCEAVLDGDVVDHIRTDPDLRESVRELLESGRANLYRYEDSDAEMTMSIISDGVLMCGQHDPRSFPEAVATNDDVVVEWATSWFESLRAESTPIDVASVTS